MEAFVTFVLVALITIVLFLQWNISRTRYQAPETSPEFRTLQKSFFIPYFLAIFADWLQGPYVYRLYSQYGYSPTQVAVLYIIGFGASVVFGTCTGSLADQFGRKRMCRIFSVLYILCCVTKLSSSFWCLALGRVFGGVSTSILFSTFESWYVSEHIKHQQYPADWISHTFSVTTFWNGFLAVLAGILADFGAEWLKIGPVAPFLFAIPCLIVCGCYVHFYWGENYGSRQHHFENSCTEGLRTIFRNKIILLLGITQSMFESIMYIFVFLWTPVLDPWKADAADREHWPLGIVFSCFMVCIMIGSSLHTFLMRKKVHPTQLMFAAMSISFVSMTICSWSISFSSITSSMTSFGSFLLLEMSVGLYFPSISYLKSQIIPEKCRASVMNWFRLPMNVIICVVLAAKSGANQSVFLCCCVLAIIGLLSCAAFTKQFNRRNDIRGRNMKFCEEEQI